MCHDKSLHQLKSSNARHNKLEKIQTITYTHTLKREMSVITMATTGFHKAHKNVEVLIVTNGCRLRTEETWMSGLMALVLVFI